MYYETEDGVIFVNNGYVDINGNPVKKTKREYPYSYDPYVVWKKIMLKQKAIQFTQIGFYSGITRSLKSVVWMFGEIIDKDLMEENQKILRNS